MAITPLTSCRTPGVQFSSALDSVTANKSRVERGTLAQVQSVVGWLRRRAARIGDAARPAPVSRRSGRTPAAGSVGTPEHLSPMPSGHGSDDNNPRTSGGAGASFVRGTRLGDPGTHGEAC